MQCQRKMMLMLPTRTLKIIGVVLLSGGMLCSPLASSGRAIVLERTRTWEWF